MALPSTTIVPFDTLPSCAAACYPLYDANGGCVPPAAPTGDINSYGACFCGHSRLQPFLQSANGVCDAACQPDGLSSIQSWFTSFCADKNTAATAATTSSGRPTSTSAAGANANQGGGTWIQQHMRWVIMIIVIIVGIIAIWTGACIWRRKYLKKKDRMYELGKGLPSTIAVNTQGNLVGPGVNRNSNYSSEPGAFMSSGTGAEKHNGRH